MFGFGKKKEKEDNFKKVDMSQSTKDQNPMEEFQKAAQDELNEREVKMPKTKKTTKKKKPKEPEEESEEEEDEDEDGDEPEEDEEGEDSEDDDESPEGDWILENQVLQTQPVLFNKKEKKVYTTEEALVKILNKLDEFE